MKDFNDFIATLDSNYFDKLEKVLKVPEGYLSERKT